MCILTANISCESTDAFQFFVDSPASYAVKFVEDHPENFDKKPPLVYIL